MWEQNCMWLFYYFNIERNYGVLNSNNTFILFNKNMSFNKIETESKMGNPLIVLERWTLCFSSYKNRKLKVKLWWVGARERKKKAFFVLFIFFEWICFKICVLSQCVVYWIHFQNIHTLLLLIFKIVESSQFYP